MKNGKQTILLRHDSGWMIVVDSGFPSTNYLVFKRDVWNSKQKLPPHNVAYCGNIESALNRLFSQLIIEHVGKNKDYRASLQDLRKAIYDARKDLNDLLKPQS